MSDNEKPQYFYGEPENKFVKAFVSTMERQGRQVTATQIVTALVYSKFPPWLCEQLLADLTKACTFVPPRKFAGRPKLTVIPGEKSNG